MIPNFLIIGAQKAGTTALWHYLNQHPQIYMSPVKEPGFFDFEGEKPNFSGPGDAELYNHVVTDIEEYRQLFQGAANEIAIGEATTWYLYSQKAPERIKHYIPDVKLIVILRNPVDRAYSSFMHAIRDEREPLDFAKALGEEEIRINQNWEYLWRYKQMGFYSIQLKCYFDNFDISQIKVYLYEDLNNNPAELIKDIFQFLDVDDTFMPEVFTRLNISGTRKNKTIDALLNTENPVRNFLRPILPVRLRKNIANYLRTQNSLKPQCPLDIQKELIEVFREDILELQNLIQRDLSKWLEA
ncbi:MAG: sulfotransferase [Calothrix sp. MO_167.B12]|nr:sulfotransferase [Calothrix sp. MO_167.B12]